MTGFTETLLCEAFEYQHKYSREIFLAALSAYACKLGSAGKGILSFISVQVAQVLNDLATCIIIFSEAQSRSQALK